MAKMSLGAQRSCTGTFVCGLVCYSVLVIVMTSLGSRYSQTFSMTAEELFGMNATRNNTSFIINPKYCKVSEYCIGPECDVMCKQPSTSEMLIYEGHVPQVRDVVDVEYSRQCIFLYPTACETCKCVNGNSTFKNEEELKHCQPCQFKQLGWLRADERNKCSPEICPLFFPQSCGMALRTSKYLAYYLNNSLTGGFWIALIGDSHLRGIFLQAVAFLTIRSTPLNITINSTNHYDDFYVCCSATLNYPGSFPAFSHCAVNTSKSSPMWSLPLAVADEFASRAAAHPRQIPACVSFQFAAHATAVPKLFDALDANYRRTGVRPVAVSVNPGLHSLLVGFDLDRIVEDLRLVHRRCATLFSNPAAPATESSPPIQPAPDGPACLFHTTPYTAIPRPTALSRGHARTYSNIRGYNAAAAAAWAEGVPQMPIVDSGALSLVPAVMNSIDGDGIHFRAEGNPFYLLGWQMVLHSALARGAQICERSRAGGRGASGFLGVFG